MTIALDKKKLLNFLKKENDFILDLLLTHNVPDSIEDDDCDEYLLPSKKNEDETSNIQRKDISIDELQERLKTIKNKMKSKKKPMSERAQKKREAKKLKKNKEFKKVLVSAAKAVKNERHKQLIDNEDGKKDIKPVKPKPVFNEEGKIVFSKFDFASHPGAKVKKSHQNPREILKQIKATDQKINELKEQGDSEKALELKNEIAWKKAFDKVEGKKVKDDPQLLYKAIKKRKDEKKRSKKQWVQRKNKVESGIEQRQKKRQENIDKRIKDKRIKKLKTASKRGKVIPGF